MSEPRSPLVWPLTGIALVTLWRVVWLNFNQIDLFVDETQYWLWGQEPAFGYFSKPPLIGWVIRAATGLGGSDAAFWVRLPGPLLYGLAGVIVSFAARAIWPVPAAAWAGFAYTTLPGIAVLALFVSTDDVLIPFFALGLLAALRLSAAPSAGWALVLGAAIGLGLMSKYAMIFFAALLIIAWAFLPGFRPRARHAATVAVVALIIVAPNLWWNLSNGFITFAHTADNAGWRGIAWNWPAVGEFTAIQIAAFGPVLAVAFAWAAYRGSPALEKRNLMFLLLFSLPIFGFIILQALIRNANGNWAAPAFVAATVLVVPWLARHGRGWLIAGLGLNLAFTLALPLAPAFPSYAVIGGRDVFERARGVRALSEAALTLAGAQNITTLIADDRRVLADLAYRSKGTGVDVYAWPPVGAPGNHYQLTRPLPPDAGAAIAVLRLPLPQDCAGRAEIIDTWIADRGSFRGQPLRFVLLPDGCG